MGGQNLLDNGFTVHAPIRNFDEKREHLDKIAENHQQNKYFEADLLNFGSYKEAMEGCQLVFTQLHHFLDAKDAQRVNRTSLRRHKKYLEFCE